MRSLRRLALSATAVESLAVLSCRRPHPFPVPSSTQRQWYVQGSSSAAHSPQQSNDSLHHGSGSSVSHRRPRQMGEPRPSPQQQQQQQQQQQRSQQGSSTRTGVMAKPLPVCDGPPLPQLQRWMNAKQYRLVEAYVDAHYDPEKQSLLPFCKSACDARDVVLALMRVYVALGRMEKVRTVFLAALRDLSSRGPSLAGDGAAAEGAPLLNASVFNGYLEALTRRRNFDKDEVVFVLDAMRRHHVEANALTYHYLIELHIRAGYNPLPLWQEAFHEKKLRPLPATVQTVLLRVVPNIGDGSFAIEVTREALACGAGVMDKRILAELIEQGLRSASSSSDSPPTATATDTSTSTATATATATASFSSSKVVYPPEVLMWLMLELEVRCVLDKASFVQYIQKHHVVELLLRCARSADATTAAEVLALMDRHVMTKTADVLSLVVWCWAQAGELTKAVDMVELMARKGYLELTDPMKKHHVESLRYTMDRSFLMVLADAIASSHTQFDLVLAHLRKRRADGLVVSAHALDVLVLAAAKLGEEKAALQLALSYPTEWGVQPRTATLNCLLVGRSNGSFLMLRSMYEAMLKAGVQPSPLTFRILIRQSVLGDSIDDAVAYLEEVGTHPGLRVEAEMVLPVMERAARVGDGETVNRISKFSLDCDIGIDGAVLGNIMKLLLEAGQSVEVLRGHQPLHEALRSRSKVGRQRARNELIL